MRDELTLNYQPIVSSGDGVVTGVEALVRWTHPALGKVTTLRIVQAAERTHLIDQIGAWVLEQSCRDHNQWSRAHP